LSKEISAILSLDDIIKDNPTDKLFYAGMIDVRNIKKSYGQQEALKGISFSIKQGEFYGLLGPNGAGKTTTISIMSSILKPDSGKVFIDGHNIYDKPFDTKKS